jgi:hypothetical protein
MGDLKPLGSEKLEGISKLKRIMEIATYKETPRYDNKNYNGTTSYSVELADGNTYGIVYEKSGYIIKKGLNESNLDYMNDIRERKYYRSYSEAMKKLNLVASELNRIHENYEGISLLGEQPEVKKKFVLKQNKPKKSEPAPDMGDMGATPPPPSPAPDMGATPPPPAPDMTTPPPPPSPDMGETPPPPPDMGGMGETPPPPDMGGMGETMPDTGEEPMPEEEPIPGEDGEEPIPGIGDESTGDEDEDESTGGPSSLKTIQKLTGRLSQKIRTFDKEKGLDSQDIKYVVNSILSAIDLSKLDDEDRDDILDKLEEYDEYDMGEEGDLDLSGEDLGSEEPIPGGDLGVEEPIPGEEPNELKTESKVDKVLKSYFKINNVEKPLLEEKRKKDFLNNKIKKINILKEIENLSESSDQYLSAKFFLKENPTAKLVGKTNKENLVFVKNNKQFKITPRGIVL